VALSSLHRMTKLEVVLEGEHLPFLQGLLRRADVQGYTLVRDVAGMGHHGPHAGRLTYDDLGSFVMVIAVGLPARMEEVAEQLGAFFAERSGVLFLSDVQVLRATHFAPA
jgi:hypothetical protein